MFIYNSFKTFNENSKNAASSGEPKKYENLVNLLWEDTINFFNIATDDVIPDSLKKYKKDIVKLRIEDDPPELPRLFEL